MNFPYVLTIIRLVVPIFILKWPLTGIFLSSLADTLDWKFFPFHTAADYQYYQIWDKTLDMFSQLFIALIVLRWQEIRVRTTALVLFVYRFLGVMLFLLTNFRPLLVIFPNMFDDFVIFYLLALHFFKREELSLSTKSIGEIVFVLAIPKLFHEYFVHYLEKQPWEIYDIGKYLGFTGIYQELINTFTWGSLIYVVPILILLFLIRAGCLSKTR